MIDSLLKKLSEYNFIDWGVLLHGFRGIPGSNLKIKASDIAEFATNQLVELSEKDEGYGIVIELASANYYSEGEVISLLARVCIHRGINLDISLRRWRVIMLIEILDDLPDDPMYALISLTDFWMNWGNPPESPHIIQGVNSEITPDQYYSPEHLNLILREHNHWIEKELIEVGVC